MNSLRCHLLAHGGGWFRGLGGMLLFEIIVGHACCFFFKARAVSSHSYFFPSTSGFLLFYSLPFVTLDPGFSFVSAGCLVDSTSVDLTWRWACQLQHRSRFVYHGYRGL
ncbi:hypothetical protein B0H66DRAFT_326121 [Apodospora peruviana]|uniref:Uncharacterized protein n=1 Tax=Apodospora peruviana TaxID=516989 RepID=A0AAE0HXU6_9PEZI|nr:hypothetical protein B0H66DRAFT_326121 [Apodospora peruviana]